MFKFLLNTVKKYEQIFIIIFLIAAGFLKLPSFYIFIDSTFFSTHTISKVITILLFLLTAIQSKYQVLLKKSPVFIFLLIIFFAQSLSVVNAIEITAFLKQYQNLIIDLLLFILAFFYIQSDFLKRNIIRYIYIIAGIIISLEVFFLFLPNFFIIFFTSVIPIQKEFMDLYIFNLQNLSRINLFLHSELFYPFFLEEFFNSKKGIKIKMLFLIGLFVVFILSLASKFRTRLVQSIFSISAYLLSLRKSLYRYVLLFILFLLFAGVLIFFIEINNHTVFDRIFAPDKRQDLETLSFRREQLNEAIDHLKAYPLLGVGLGNYKSHMTERTGVGIKNPYEKIHYEVTLEAPHSIFIQLISETGILGLLSYILLLVFFLIHDLNIYRRETDNHFEMMFVIASWTVFLYGIINPFDTVFLNGWFWFLRGIVHGLSYNLKTVKNIKKHESKR